MLFGSFYRRPLAEWMWTYHQHRFRDGWSKKRRRRGDVMGGWGVMGWGHSVLSSNLPATGISVLT